MVQYFRQDTVESGLTSQELMEFLLRFSEEEIPSHSSYFSFWGISIVSFQNE